MLFDEQSVRGHRPLPAGARSRSGADGVSHCVGPTHARERSVKAQRLPCHISDRPTAHSVPASRPTCSRPARSVKAAIAREQPSVHFVEILSAISQVIFELTIKPVLDIVTLQTVANHHRLLLRVVLRFVRPVRRSAAPYRFASRKVLGQLSVLEWLSVPVPQSPMRLIVGPLGIFVRLWP